jgi:4-hydroxy-tetrahydrodipicolinate synthase
VKPKLSGVFAALITPLDDRGSIDYCTFERLIDFLIERGVDGVAVGGATGEYPHFDIEERKKLISRAARRLAGGKALLAGIGTSSIYTTLQLGEHAVQSGCRALLVPMPHFFQYEQHDLAAYCQTVSRTLRAPCLLYNLPSFTNGLQCETSIQLLQAEENLIGIKDSGSDRRSLARLAQANGQGCFSLLVGNDSLLLDALNAGWDGVISGIAGFLPELTVSLYRNFRAGEHQAARNCQTLLDGVIEEVVKLPIPWAIRVGLDMRGLPNGPFHVPLSAVRKHRIEELHAWFSQWLPEHIPALRNEPTGKP